MFGLNQERHLLLGILAAELNFISRQDLVKAIGAWTLDGQKPLDQILLDRKALAPDTHRLLEALAAKYLDLHGGDAEKSLASLSNHGLLPEHLAHLGGGPAASPDVYATQAAAPGSGSRPTGLRFCVLRPLARGGLGEVFVAMDQELHREVVLKEIQGRFADDPASRARFVREAEITGGLEHPGIAPVYGLGEYPDGRPYYAMRFIRGDSLETLIAQFHEKQGLGRQAREHVVEFRKLLARFLGVCNAMEYAHSRGVLHRDLKPANIILGKFGETFVLDWGLAKPLGQSEGSANEAPLRGSVQKVADTVVGAVVGTPQFMSPEQACGRSDLLGPASDVYSLGATLYCLLTGQPPFAGTDTGIVLQAVQRGGFPPPRQIRPAVPQALEAVCLKAMALRPEDRYPSCRRLADDLEHWLADEPVSAVPEHWRRRCGRWLRHHKAWTRAGVAALLTIALVSSLAALLIQRSLHSEGQARQRAQAARDKADAANAVVAAQLTRARMLSGMQQAADGDPLGSLSWFADALRRDQGSAAEPLQRLRLTAVLRQCPRLTRMWFHDGRVMAATFDANGSRVATAGADFTARVWDVATGDAITPALAHPQVVGAVVFDPAGARLATACEDHAARIWDARTGRLLLGPLKHDGASARLSSREECNVLGVQFSPDGRQLLTFGEDGTARVWNAATGAAVFTLRHKQHVQHAEYSSDGQRLVTASEDGTAQVWDAPTGQPAGPPLRHDGMVFHAAFSPDGARIVTASADHKGRVWDAGTGAVLTTVAHRAAVRYAAFDALGQRIATTGDDNVARIWDAGTGQARATLHHLSIVYAARFSPDGRWLATCSDDNTARIWDTQTGRPGSVPLPHFGTVRTVQFHPKDVRQVLTATAGGTARIWETRPTDNLLAEDSQVTSAAFSSDGTQILTANAAGVARLLDAATGKPRGPAMKHGGRIHRARFAPSGRRLVTCSSDRTAQVWDADTGMPLGAPLRHAGDVRLAELSPDGRLVVTASVDNIARVWHADTGVAAAEFSGHAGEITWAAFSPDGRRIVTGSIDNTAQVWEAGTGRRLAAPLRHSEDVVQVQFSPEGSRVVTACNDTTARVWHVDTAQLAAPPLQHGSNVIIATFSPDGRRVLTASDDNTARIWDAASGQPLTPPMEHDGSLRRARFDASGTRVVTASADNQARVWDAHTGDPITPPLIHVLKLTDAAFSPDGTQVVTASDRGVSLWDLTPDERSVDDLVLVAKVLSSGWIDATGGFVPLDRTERRTLWQQLGGAPQVTPAKHGPPQGEK